MNETKWDLSVAPRTRIEGRYWRMLSPRWSSQPHSGAGAARFGGRWNAKGRSALYLSQDHGTAIAEYMQSLVHPGTLTPYDIVADPVLDVGTPATLALLSAFDLLALDWRSVRDVEQREPETWALAEAASAAGYVGICVPSSQTRGINLVLWSWNDGAGAHVEVVDPSSDLPHDARSWS